MSERPTPKTVTIEDIRSRHVVERPYGLAVTDWYPRRCQWCRLIWPCDTRRVLDELDGVTGTVTGRV
jgi:hypothetical protein